MKVKDFPQRIEIELASACNLKCTYCPRKFVPGLDKFMDISFFKKLIDEIAAYPETTLVLHRRGESLLHPDFTRMCEYVKGKFREIQLATNTTLLDDTKSRIIIDTAHFISFSIDIPEAYEKNRLPAKYGEIESKILRFLELNKGKIRTQVSMVKTKETPNEGIKIFGKIWRGKIDRIRIYEEHSRNGIFGSLQRKRKRRMPCIMPFTEISIYYDGKIGRCNHDWNGVPMGDAARDSIKYIWKSNIYKSLRRQHETLQIKDDMCKGCHSWYPKVGEQGTGLTLQ